MPRPNSPNTWALCLVTAITVLLLPLASFAGFRISTGLGLGSTTSTNEVDLSEGPLVNSYSIEFCLHSRMYIGVEHLRSLNMSPMSTSISFTGLFGRYYLNSSPTPYANGEDLRPGEIVIRDLSYFIGGGVGFGQSSLPINENNQTANAAGIYFAPRGGVELNLSRRVGVRGELMIVQTLLGTGTLSSMSLLGSVYYSF